MAKLLFEHRTCERCGGSGRWGHGRVCYGCGGHGAKLTKRGAAAQRWLDHLRQRTFADLTVGQEYLSTRPLGNGDDWMRIETIEHDESGHIRLTSRSVYSDREELFIGPPTTTVRIRFSKVEARAMRERALAYQATL